MKLTPERIEKARFTRVQLEWLAWTLRRFWDDLGEIATRKDVAEFWAGGLAPHVNGFKHDKFIKAVTTGQV